MQLDGTNGQLSEHRLIAHAYCSFLLSAWSNIYEKKAIPTRLYLGNHRVENKRDARGASQDRRIGAPLRPFTHVAPCRKPSDGRVAPHRKGMVKPAQRGIGEDPLTSRIVEAMEQMSGATCAVAQARIDHLRIFETSPRTLSCELERLDAPSLTPASGRRRQQRYGNAEIAVAPRKPAVCNAIARVPRWKASSIVRRLGRK